MRRFKQKWIVDEMNFDSLMDILTCLVGIILLIIVITVIGARGINIKMFLPITKAPSNEKKRVLCICENEHLKLLDEEKSINILFNSKMETTYDNIPRIVKMANSKNYSDKYFKYSLDFTTFKKNGNYARDFILIVEKKNVNGDSISDLDRQSSSFQRTLKQFDPAKIWIAFSVDYKSTKVFKKAREICKNKNFATGWDPGSIEFPIKELIYSNYDYEIFTPKPKFSNKQ